MTPTPPAKVHVKIRHETRTGWLSSVTTYKYVPATLVGISSYTKSWCQYAQAWHENYDCLVRMPNGELEEFRSSDVFSSDPETFKRKTLQ